MARNLNELSLLIDGLGHTITTAIDPVDGHKVAVLGWVEVSQVVDHYEAEIKKRDDLLESNHRAYLSVQGISDEPGVHMRGDIHD